MSKAPTFSRGQNVIFDSTGKSLSEALILESVNPQYDKRLNSPKNTSSKHVQILFWMSKQKQENNFYTQHVLNLYFSCISMNNLLSYCGLTDSRRWTSDTDLPVNRNFPNSNKFIIFDQYLSKTLLSYLKTEKKNTLLNKDVSILNGFRFRIIFWAHTFFANFLVSFLE